MSSPLTVRRVRFDFDGVSFHWHPSPALSAIGNATSFGAVAFERMVCNAVKDALPLIRDDALSLECRDFMAQEAMHSAAHRSHVKALVASHPDLQDVQAEVEALCDRLFARRSLKSRLGFAAVLEGILPAVGRQMVERRVELFEGADPNVSALLLWHFCEEIEHEATAVSLFRHLYPRTPRAFYVPLTLRFVAAFTRVMEREFSAHAPSRSQGSRWRYDPHWRQLGRLARRTAFSAWPGRTESMPQSDWSQGFLDRIAESGDPVGAMRA